MMVIVWSALALGVLAVALLGLAAYGRSRWARATQALLGQLEAARLPARASRYDTRELEGLPAPVQRYFRAVLKDGQPIVTVVTVQHIGTFNVTALGGRERWVPFTSEQRVTTNRPGFVWNARMSNYQERDGLCVPLNGEAAWLTQGGRKPYWRGTITSATYEFATE